MGNSGPLSMLRTIASRVQSRGMASVANPVDWKRAVPIVKKAVKKAAEAEEKKTRKLLSFRNVAIGLGCCAAAATVGVQGCKLSLDFREKVATDQPEVFAKIREWFTTGKLRQEMTMWELEEAEPAFQPGPETAVIVKLQSGTIVQMQVDGTWSLEHGPVIDVAFPDDESQDVLSNRYLQLVTTPMVVEVIAPKITLRPGEQKDKELKEAVLQAAQKTVT